jgi:N-methylhydantoinase B
MRYLIERTAQSFLISQLHDISAGIWDHRGRTVAIPVGLPAQFIGGGLSVKYILNEFGPEIYPGDVFLVNDPYHGYTCHPPDWGVFRPIFYRDRLKFFTLARAHVEDTGAAYPGAYYGNPYDVHAEGLLIPPVKIFERGQERSDVLKLIMNNVRLCEGVRIDTAALVAATALCERRVHALLDRYGEETVEGAIEEMFDRTEQAVRAAIRRIPDGRYEGASATDDDGVVYDVPVWVRCDAIVQDDELTLDFSRSDPQQKGFVNATYFTTFNCAIAAAILFFDPALADFHNEGSMRRITVIAPEGTVVNARYPAPVGGSPVAVGGNVMEAVIMALSAALPDRAIAGWGRRYGHYIFGPDPRRSRLYVYPGYEAEGGAGAVAGYDGYHGTGSIGTLGEIARPNVEEVEIRYPWRSLWREFAVDSCGAGKWRGGAGFRWAAINEGGEAGMHTGASHGERTSAPGALGGQPTPPNRCLIIRDGQERLAPCHRLHPLKPGDVVARQTGGGAGVGPPAERDPQKVWEDVVVHEIVSLEAARAVYRVAIDPLTMKINWEATETLRSSK